MGAGRRPALDGGRRRRRGDHRPRGAPAAAGRTDVGTTADCACPHPTCRRCTSPSPTGSDPSSSTCGEPGSDASGRGREAEAWFTKVVGCAARLVYLDDPTCTGDQPGEHRADRPGVLRRRLPAAVDERGVARRAERPHRRRAARGRGPAADDAVPSQPRRARDRAVERGRLAGDPHRRRAVPRGQGVRSVRHDDPRTRRPQRRGWSRSPRLARHRRWDGKTWFGINLVPDTPGGRSLRVGDEIKVVSAAAPGVGRSADGPADAAGCLDQRPLGRSPSTVRTWGLAKIRSTARAAQNASGRLGIERVVSVTGFSYPNSHAALTGFLQIPCEIEKCLRTRYAKTGRMPITS